MSALAVTLPTVKQFMKEDNKSPELPGISLIKK